MYIVSKGTVEDLRKDPMLTTFYTIPQDKEDSAVRFELWGTSFTDPEEYTELRLFDADGNVIHKSRCAGY